MGPLVVRIVQIMLLVIEESEEENEQETLRAAYYPREQVGISPVLHWRDNELLGLVCI